MLPFPTLSAEIQCGPTPRRSPHKLMQTALCICPAEHFQDLGRRELSGGGGVLLELGDEVIPWGQKAWGRGVRSLYVRPFIKSSGAAKRSVPD